MAPPYPETPRPPPWWTVLILALGLILWWGAPALLRPGELLAWPLGEADNHLWMHWQAVYGEAANWPEGTAMPLMDPVNLPWFALGFWVGPTMAWNGAWVANMLLALLGGAWLGHEATQRIEGAWLGGVVLGASPFLLGMGAFGITEAWPLGWLALFAAALHRGLRIGGRRGLGWLALAAVCLCAFAAGGWYHAVWAVIAGPIVGLWAWLGTEERRVVDGGKVALVGALAALPLVPRLSTMLDARGVWAHRWTGDLPHVPAYNPGWQLGPHGGGADLLNFIAPTLDGSSAGRSVYLGVAVIALAVLGALLERRALVLALGADLFLLLALGPVLVVAGNNTGVPMPAGWLTEAVPALSGLTHWYRAVGPAVVMLVPLVAQGTIYLLDRLRLEAPAAAALALFVAVEGQVLSTNAWPAASFDPQPPAALMDLDGTGALVLLPFDNGRAEFEDAVPRIYDRWGPWLGRPLSENYEGADVLLRTNRLIAAADRACGVQAEVPRAWRPSAGFSDPARLSDAVAQSAAEALVRDGADWVVLLPERAPTARVCQSLLEHTLGAPDVRTEQVVAWSLR